MPLKGLRLENLEEAQAHLDHWEEQKGSVTSRIIVFDVLLRRQEIHPAAVTAEILLRT
jgi:hypothetical protein